MKLFILFLFISFSAQARVQTAFAFKKSSSVGLSNFGSYRGFTDGTYATTCNNYRNPTGSYTYSGATGDGVYRIKISATTYDVYCLMTYDTNGWIRGAAVYPNQRATPINSDYSSTVNYIAHNLGGVYSVNGKMIVYSQTSGACASGASSLGLANGYGPLSTNVPIWTYSFNAGNPYSSSTGNFASYLGNFVYYVNIANDRAIGISVLFSGKVGLFKNGASYGYYYYDEVNNIYTTCAATDYMYIYVY